jgi:hypothetical protein
VHPTASDTLSACHVHMRSARALPSLLDLLYGRQRRRAIQLHAWRFGVARVHCTTLTKTHSQGQPLLQRLVSPPLAAHCGKRWSGALQMYWNSKLSGEREVLMELLGPDDVLADMCAGVGPIAVPAAKRCRMCARPSSRTLTPALALTLTQTLKGLLPEQRAASIAPTLSCSRYVVWCFIRAPAL